MFSGALSSTRGTQTLATEPILTYSFCVNSVEKSYRKACINNLRKNKANKKGN